MSTSPDADLTLPSVVAALPSAECERRLVLTIVFHPDTARIGEKALLPRSAGSAPPVVGRRSPAFARAGYPGGRPLDEPHVSRQALVFTGDENGLLLRRLPASSRCRAGGRELRDAVELSRQQLEQGVPLLLGHSVVLLLRLGPWRTPPEPAIEFSHLCGSSGYMADLREQVMRVAGSGLDVLVRGETGTGKELVARAIHQASQRSSGPMVSVNMAAIPAGLAAATLFGSSRGAFTGATTGSDGFFTRARGGTLFLDEIGDTPPEVQPQLLRALQEREIQAVGGAIHKVDVRVISATDAELEGNSCDFKAALRHRLGACEIRLLPLREHPEDIGELLLHFLTADSKQSGQRAILPGEHSPAPELAAWAELFHGFLTYGWPGNVRELENFASQLVLASDGGLALPGNILRALQAPVVREPATASRDGRRRSIRGIEQVEFDGALRASAYEVATAARQLGVSRQAVYRRMEESCGYRLAGQVPLAELERALATRGGDASATALDLQVSATGLRKRLRGSGLSWF